LKQESQFSSVAKGVFGNAQQPVMVLPNLYFFARGAANSDYLEKTDSEVLTDFARELGDAEGVLIPAWSCLKLSLRDLLPKRCVRCIWTPSLQGASRAVRAAMWRSLPPNSSPAGGFSRQRWHPRPLPIKPQHPLPQVRGRSSAGGMSTATSAREKRAIRSNGGSSVRIKSDNFGNMRPTVPPLAPA
jgi:hypothetical protein